MIPTADLRRREFLDRMTIVVSDGEHGDLYVSVSPALHMADIVHVARNRDVDDDGLRASLLRPTH